MPKGYAIFTLNVRDETRLFEYIHAATPSVLEAGGNLIVAGAPERVLEGEWHGNRTAILEFPTVEAAQHWYECAEYQSVIGIRHDAAESNAVTIAGFQPPGVHADPASIRIGPDEGEKIPRGPRYHRVLAQLPELEVVDVRLGPGFSVDPHIHGDHVDSFYVLEGEAEFTLGDEIVRAGAGTWVAVPVGMLHGFRNTGDGELRMLNIQAPNTGFAQWLRANS